MWRMEQSLGSSATDPSASSTMSCHQFVILHSCYNQKRSNLEKDLKQDVVEEKGAEHATQLLALIHDPVTLPHFET